MTQARFRAKETLKRPTALLIDKSGSMHEAIDAGMRLGPIIAGSFQPDLYVYAFNAIPHPTSRRHPICALLPERAHAIPNLRLISI